MIAVLYDVHGNLPALEAVVDDARARGADRWILGGDFALFGPEPEATVALLRSLAPAVWIRGNGERWTASPDEAPPDNPIVPDAIAACREALGDAEIAALGALPFGVADGDTRYVHASPVSDVRSFMPEPGDDEAELLAGVAERRLIFGHTHLPFARRAGDVELVNPGSVGMPFDGDPRAAYAIVADDGRLEHVRIAYDHDAAAARMRARWPGADWAETVAGRIQHARMDA